MSQQWVRRRGRRVAAVFATAVALAMALTGCTLAPNEPGAFPSGSFPLPPPETHASPVPTPSATLPGLVPLAAPTEPHFVARRFVNLTRDDRPLRTLLLFPRAHLTHGEWDVADGTFPLLLFSHGLGGTPAQYEPSLTLLAAAGFIVAAPTYPHTSGSSAEYNPADLVNQPEDASAVITAILDLAADPEDRLYGHIDPNRVAAGGHSAGGYTTMGMLTFARDERIRSAVVIAGASVSSEYEGPATSVLFVHGDADDVVPYGYGRATYEQVPWPKAFLTVVGGDHTGFLTATEQASVVVAATVLDFLRATLYGDPDALARIPAEAAVDPITRFDSTLVAAPALPAPTPSPTPTPTPSPTPEPSASASPDPTASPSGS